jgi:uncharacterized protein (UPF0261 family)
MKKVILCIGTLDTKGPEITYMKELIEKKGHTALIMDISTLERPTVQADIPVDEIAKAGGESIENVRKLKETEAAEVVKSGGMRIARDLYNSGRFHGVIGMGGSMGSYIASGIMRELPVGVPKLLLSSQKVVQAGLRGYVGTKDILVMPSIADLAGLNMFTKKAIANAVEAAIAMVEGAELTVSEKPLVFMSMMGTTTGCGLKVKSNLENRGFEVIVFHTIGIGGMTLEELAEAYPLRGVIELALNEIGNHLFGGASTAGPKRLEAAGRKAVAQLITPGNVDFIGFIGLEGIPAKYREDHKFVIHNPQASAVRLNGEEMRAVAEFMAKKLNEAKGPVTVLIPLRGFSAWDREGGVFYDPSADRVFIDSLKETLAPHIMLREIDAHINDIEFVNEVVSDFSKLLQL